ncbi:hypothetical protein HJC23_012431 [Cyclotella cryptica]|uniref:N-acetyltransferase ESCO acetyl-transferase domain-containing protein n=1 Tax=Cyclotella cryptica TaxID=29204 RepID=A0ABD3Q2V9_9STRA|eukprot:CCRYP_009385-RA/>CCRYP_009385-RA protein AED:0.23 eAED:0.23 QI:0/-1/0/1/-1/1/1/0/499
MNSHQSSKKKAIKRKRSTPALTKTPSSTILTYFKRRVPNTAMAPSPMIHCNAATFGTPTTSESIDSNHIDARGAFMTQKGAARKSNRTDDTQLSGEASASNEDGGATSSPTSPCDERNTTNNGPDHHTPDRSHNNHEIDQTWLTPPSPCEATNPMIETPPSPCSEVIMESPPTEVGAACIETKGYLIQRREDGFGTPSEGNVSDGRSTLAKFGTPLTHESNLNLLNRQTDVADPTTPPNETLHSDTSNSHPSNKKNEMSSQPRRSNKPRKKSQRYLDLGQKSFASHTICPICSSLIVHGTREDQQDHSQICKSFKEGVVCLGFKKERCLARFGDERIIEIKEGNINGRKKVEEVKCIVDKELGFAQPSIQKRQQLDSLEGITSYLYISNKRVVGLLIVKRIQRAYELLYERSDTTTYTISRSTNPHSAIVGIHQIWVHNLHRHKGIATKLVECARSNFVFGMIIPREKVAFSSPTEDGVRFARGYMSGEGEKVLVYDIS